MNYVMLCNVMLCNLASSNFNFLSKKKDKKKIRYSILFTL